MRDSKFKPARKIVLLGKTGDGKSSSGNTILGKQTFTTESSPQSMTSESTKGEAKIDGRIVTVIDTPGIFDTRLDENVVKSEIIKSTIECAPAVDALVIVLKVERYTRQETEILDKIVECCGEETFKHSVVLFTHGEQLEDQTIEGFVHKSPKLKELVNKCGGRCHVIDNKYWNACDSGEKKSNGVQVKNLLDTIDEMVNKNGCYTNELMLEIEDDIQGEMNCLLATHLSDLEKREIAKKKVIKKYLIRLVGVTTGTLIGAFMGIFVAVGSVVALLKAAKLKDAIKAIGIAVTAAGTMADKAAAAAAAGGAATVSATAAVVEAGIAAGAAGATATAAATTGAAGATATAAATAGAAGATATAAATAGAAGATATATAGAAGATATAAATAGAAGATAAAGEVVAVEVGAAGAGTGAAAGSGIAVGVVLGAAAVAGAIGGGITGYKAAAEADSVLDAIKLAAKVNFENAKEVVKKAEQLPSNIYKKIQ